jgi:hypothetical protein
VRIIKCVESAYKGVMVYREVGTNCLQCGDIYDAPGELDLFNCVAPADLLRMKVEDLPDA